MGRMGSRRKSPRLRFSWPRMTLVLSQVSNSSLMAAEGKSDRPAQPRYEALQDVLQGEAFREESQSSLPMFGKALTEG